MSNLEPNELNELVQRFAISALSIERHDEAMNEEILIDKYTGEFFIKTKDGSIVSPDIFSRSKNATENAIRIAELTGMKGNLYKIDFDELQLPGHIDYSLNILENEPIVLPKKCSEILINLDMDEYELIGNVGKPIHSETKVVVDITCGGMNKHIEKSLININYFVIDVNDFNDTDDIIIENIKLVDVNSDIEKAIIIHNIFVTVNNK